MTDVGASDAAILQLTRQGAVWHDDPARALPLLREEFRARHCVRLPGLVAPGIMAAVHRHMDDAAFENRLDHEIAPELTMKVNASTGILQFVLNDPQLYRLVEAVAEHRPIRLFVGRVYRRSSGMRHSSGWHNDLVGGRLVGLSVNVGPGPYEGGLFEIRDAESATVFASIANVGVGNAILFRLGIELEHRITNVEGPALKTAFAGWFREGPAYDATDVAPDAVLMENDSGS